LPVMIWSKTLKRSGNAAMMAMNLTMPSERFNGFRPAHRRQKACLLDRGIVPHLSSLSQWIFLAFYVVLGGHFWRRRPCWCGCCHRPLVIGLGRRLLTLDKPHIRVGIVSIYNSQRIFFWPKF
jgi:hypothetical protein